MVVPVLARRPVSLPALNSTTVRSFTANEFKASYGLLVKYEHGGSLASLPSCPALFEYTGTPQKSGDNLIVYHKDMKIAETADSETVQCTDGGMLQLTSSEKLMAGSQGLRSFEDAIAGVLDAETVFNGLQESLIGKRYFVGISDSTRMCGGQKWFGRQEAFMFFDETDPVNLKLVSKVKNGQAVILQLSLIGDIRYMVAVRNGATCVYRVDLDLRNLQLNITRPSDSPTVSVSNAVS